MQIRFHRQSRVPAALEGLLRVGWKPQRAPLYERALRNDLRVTLQIGAGEKRVRLFAYTVTGSSRNRPHERRVEITTAYAADPRYEDAVIAYDRESDSWVGVDASRLQYGGLTHNASSFVPMQDLRRPVRDEFLLCRLSPPCLIQNLLPFSSQNAYRSISTIEMLFMQVITMAVVHFLEIVQFPVRPI